MPWSPAGAGISAISAMGDRLCNRSDGHREEAEQAARLSSAECYDRRQESIRMERVGGVERRIGVVTVTYNSGKVLPAFFKSIFAQTLSDFRLYLVDNASGDDTLAVLMKFPDPRVHTLLNAKNAGVAEGNNQGIRAALAEGCSAVLLLNNDTEFPADLFARLSAGLDEHNADMTTAKMLYFEPDNLIWCAGGWLDEKHYFNAFHYGMHEEDRGQYDEKRRVTYAPTCCLLVQRSVFEQVGLMDSRYFVYNDDVDFLYRCYREGKSLWYLPEAVLFHKVSALTGGDESEFAIRYMTRNRTYFLRKHLPAWKGLLWSLHFMLLTAPLRVLRGRDSLHIWRLRCASLLEGWRMTME
jgi:GT2 family glycosyltransferase